MKREMDKESSFVKESNLIATVLRQKQQNRISQMCLRKIKNVIDDTCTFITITPKM